MKKTILILLVTLVAIATDAEAQQTKYNYHKTGYWGNVEAEGGVLLSGGGGGSNIGFTTVHGGRLGHGVAMGLGVGVYVDINSYYYALNVPIFLETKYSPLKSGRSPFLSLRTGLSVTDTLDTGFYLAPAVGVDIGRLSLFMRYGFNLFPTSVDISFPELDTNITTTANIKMHTVSLGIAVNF
ncbi:MAG: hypothetical protein J6C56_00645 [Alistipes sp.]|nr:hypothetical protein [Alistipes sp.]